MAALVNLDAYSLVVSDEVGVTGGIHTLTSVAEAYNVSTSDNVDLILSWHLGTNVLRPPYLPVLEASGSFGNRIGTDGSLELPGLTISARTGSRLSKRLPDLGISAQATHETLYRVDAKLPTMSLSANSGARSRSLKLPTLEIAATVQGASIGTLAKRLPGLTISATSYGSGAATLDVDLPPIEASITMDAETLITLARNLPTLKVTAAASGTGSMTLSAYLPALEVAATGQAGSGSLSAYLPTLIMATLGSGAPGTSAGLTTDDRYQDYVLRHVR